MRQSKPPQFLTLLIYQDSKAKNVVIRYLRLFLTLLIYQDSKALRIGRLIGSKFLTLLFYQDSKAGYSQGTMAF